MYSLNLNPAYVPNSIQDIEPLEYFKPIVSPTMSAEDRALWERALAFLNGTSDGGWQERGAIADAIQARLARG